VRRVTGSLSGEVASLDDDGYRATALGHDKDVTVFCVCPESDWKTLQPAFDRLLGSLKRGHAE
jgi:hypothetical protein